MAKSTTRCISKHMLKSIFQSAFVQTILGFVIWAYMSLISHTTRWTLEGEEKIRDIWDSDEGLILLAWHSRIMMLPVLQNKLRKRWDNPTRRASIMISHSRDGAFVAKSAKMLGLNVVRGSASNKKKDKKQGRISRFNRNRQMCGNGDLVCITPDGPRGPREKMGLGAIKIAQRSGAPILVWAPAVRPSKKLNTWDKFSLPRLFGSGALVFDGPIYPTLEMDSEDLRIHIENRLKDATIRAEMLVGLAQPDADGVNRTAQQESAPGAQSD